MTDDARACFEAAVAAVRPEALAARIGTPTPVPGRTVLLAVGKAALSMATAFTDRLGRIEAATATVPHGYAAAFGAPPEELTVLEAGHPLPDVASAAAGRAALALAEALGDGDRLVVLVSGGGSALWFAPPDGVTMGEARATVTMLLRSGVSIEVVNAVRKRLSAVAAGRLAAAAFPAETVAFVLSDVVGDDLATIASGPTVASPTAIPTAFLDRLDLPDSVRRALREAVLPAPDDPRLARTSTRLIGSNRDAVAAAAAHARALGYRVTILPQPVTGEAREAGRRFGRLARDLAPGSALVAGGETTVTVTGDGRGGRNQEFALAAAITLDGTPRRIALLSAGTDGIDGPTDAAGALVTPETVGRARALGLDPEDHLARNDAYPLLDAVGALLRPGPTHTNVMDVQIALAG